MQAMIKWKKGGFVQWGENTWDEDYFLRFSFFPYSSLCSSKPLPPPPPSSPSRIFTLTCQIQRWCKMQMLSLIILCSRSREFSFISHTQDRHIMEFYFLVRFLRVWLHQFHLLFFYLSLSLSSILTLFHIIAPHRHHHYWTGKWRKIFFIFYTALPSYTSCYCIYSRYLIQAFRCGVTTRWKQQGTLQSFCLIGLMEQNCLVDDWAVVVCVAVYIGE